MLYFACFVLGFIACSLCHALMWWRDNQDKQLPPMDGCTIVTRKDGSQHYRRLRINEAPQQPLVVE